MHADLVSNWGQDNTYDHLVPRAYQTMIALMNYIRTVQDFGSPPLLPAPAIVLRPSYTSCWS